MFGVGLFVLRIRSKSYLGGVLKLKSKLTTAAAVFALAVTCFSGIANADTGNGAQTPYSVSVQALEGPTATDLYVNVTPTSSNYTAPSTLKKIQLKTFDQNDTLVYTRNYNNGVSSPNGTSDIVLTDVVRHQPLQTMVLVQNSQTTNTQVLTATGVVLLRPEMSVDQITAPQTAYVNSLIDISAVIKELNGDVGAASTVQILNGSTVLDTANVNVQAGGTSPVAFLAKFSQPGTYNLRALISNVQPGEYDTTHNEKDFTINIIQPDKPMQYTSNYNYIDYKITNNYNSYYEHDNVTEVGSNDLFQLQASTTDQVNPAGTFTIQLKDAQGNPFSESFSNLTPYGNGQYTAYDPSTGAHLYVDESQFGTSLTFSQYGGYYTYSRNYNSLYNQSYSDSYSGTHGSLYKANGQISAHFELPDASGVKYGGDYSIPLSAPASYDNPSSYGWWGGSYYYDYQHTNVSGYSSGVTTWNN